MARLDPNEQTESASRERQGLLQWPPTIWTGHQDSASTEPSAPQRHLAPAHVVGGLRRLWHRETSNGEENEGIGNRVSSNVPFSPGAFRDPTADKKDKHVYRRPIEMSKKLGTFSGVFVPTTLNVLSILMFLRFGFILGQAGLLGTLGKRCQTSMWGNNTDDLQVCL